jgi:hypothetical protein
MNDTDARVNAPGATAQPASERTAYSCVWLSNNFLLSSNRTPSHDARSRVPPVGYGCGGSVTVLPVSDERSTQRADFVTGSIARVARTANVPSRR